ncbi:MAG: hypothetical protein H6Q70_284 [Firmicutes bacterium]|nr:hypothetical protein [Bacillota bacterium]
MQLETKWFRLIVSAKFIVAVTTLVAPAGSNTPDSTETSCVEQGVLGLFSICLLY